ncbi:MAG: DUF642 domain-containing protein [Actinomycetia bacterium]|nr:DUF642 domain-containing protein [Actinomycetes bacterium]
MLKRQGRWSEDRGGVLLATMAVLVVTMSGLSLLRLHTNELTLVTADQTRLRAELLAELAAAEGLSRIALAPDPILGGTGAVDGHSYQYEGVRDNDGTWVVYAEATIDGVTEAVEVTRATTSGGGGGSTRPFSLFIWKRGRVTMSSDLIDGVVGTAGKLDVENASIGTRQELYQPDGKCGNCPNPVTMSGPPPLTDPVAPVGGRACPTGNFFWEVVDGQNGTPFSCTGGQVYLYGGLSVVNPPLVIAAPAGARVYLMDADVNLGGYAEDIQVIQPGGGDIHSWRSAYYGVIDAPDTRWNRSSSVSITGSLIVASIVQRWDGLAISPGLTESGGVVVGAITDWRVVSPRPGFTATVTVDGTPAPIGGGTPPDPPPNLVVDGGFETDPSSLSPDDMGTGWYQFDSGNVLGGSWSVTSGDVDLVQRDSYTVFQGDHGVDLAGVGAGEISTQLPTEDGKSYELTLLLGENTRCGPRTKTMEVVWDGSVVSRIAVNMWRSRATTTSLTLPASTGTSSLLSLRSTNWGSCSVIIDAVDVREIA